MSKKVLIYSADSEIEETRRLASRLRFFGFSVQFRHSAFWLGETEKCDAVFVAPQFLKLAEAYREKGARICRFRSKVRKESDQAVVFSLGAEKSLEEKVIKNLSRNKPVSKEAQTRYAASKKKKSAPARKSSK